MSPAPAAPTREPAATTAPPGAAGVTVPTAATAAEAPTPRQHWRRWRLPLAVVLVVVVVAVVVGLVRGSDPGGSLDPESASPGGSRALATLLRDRGVQVDRASTVDDALRAATADTTVLVPVPEIFPDLGRLAGLPTGTRLVLVTPDGPTLHALTGLAVLAPVEDQLLSPACGLTAATTAGAARLGGDRYTGPAATTVGCYPVGGAPTLAVSTKDGHQVTAVGTDVPFTNEALADDGDAALTIGLLSGRPHLLWLLPRPGESTVAGSGRGPGLLGLLPDRLLLAVAQLAVAVALVMLWRARRLGPLVSEPLPVVVRAAEVVEGRARLYRGAGARGKAATALREGARARLRGPLGLARDTTPETLVTAVAERTARAGPDVMALLYGPEPTDNRALVRLSTDLDTIEAEVRRP